MLTIPTYLTLLRIILIIPLIGLLWFDDIGARWGALIIYTLACITDFFDGWLARRTNQISDLGKFLDPTADKLLIVALIIMLVFQRRIDGIDIIAALIILMREIGVSGLREHLAGEQVQLPVSFLAKWKTAIQMVALGFLIIGNVFDLPNPISILLIGNLLLWIAALITLWTGWLYLKAGIDHMSNMSQH